MDWAPIITFALFGVWTLLAVFCGAWLQYRRSVGAPPVPGQDDLTRLFEVFQRVKPNRRPPAERKPPERKPESDRAKV